MKYVKLIARPNTWFKEGTEVYDYDAEYSEKKLVTLEHWEKSKGEWGGNGIAVRGIRICESKWEMCGRVEIGEEYTDGEWCHCDEFDVEIIEI